MFRSPTPGSLSTTDVLAAYAAHLLALAPVPVSRPRGLKVVVDAGNGMAGHTAPAVFDRLGDRVDLVPLYFELDGTFPNHEANPIEPENLADLQKAVLSEGADIGLAFDGDADRCFLVDERGRLVDPSTLTALIAARELARVPGATVIHNLITSRAVPEIVTELGGTPVRTRVGHSFIKARMAETDAIFGGEHSGHFYFRDFWRADSGMLAALHVLAALAETDRPLCALLADYERYVASRRDQLDGRRPAGRRRRAPGVVRRPAGRGARRARRPHGHARRLVVQRARLQHRTTAPAQRRGRRRGHHDPRPRRRPHRDQERPVNLDPHCSRSSSARTATAVWPCRARSWSASPAAWPTRSATTSRCCWSTRPGSPTEVPMPGYFDESRLDDERALGAVDPLLRALAESGARVRREAAEAAEATAEAVRAQPGRPSRAR